MRSNVSKVACNCVLLLTLGCIHLCHHVKKNIFSHLEIYMQFNWNVCAF